MLNTSSPVDKSFEEGSVTEIDSIRKVCKVKTLRGQNLTGVKWLLGSGGGSRSGDHKSPILGDAVMITFGLGYPLITGYLPKPLETINTFPLSIDTGEILVDTGNYSDSGRNVIGDANCPKDTLVGDRVFTSTGGGILALLRGGSILLKSTSLAQIFISKFDDLVRIVGRNLEIFTDVSSQVIKNIGGRVYSYTGYAINSNDAKVENYSFHQYAGDTALAEGVKTDYQNVTTLPTQNNIIYKEQVSTGNGGGATETLHRTLALDGTHDLVITGGGNFTRIKSTNGQVQITFNDINVITVNSSTISLSKGGVPISVVLTDSSIVSTFNGAVHTLDSNGVFSTFSGHYCNVTAAGVQLG